MKLLNSFKVTKLTILSLLNPYQRRMIKRLSTRYLSEDAPSSSDSSSSGLDKNLDSQVINYELVANQLLGSSEGFDRRML